MPLLIQYLLKLSVSLALVWLFYQLILRRLTFYNSNRWYLLLYSLCCFVIPLINLTPVLQQNEWAGNRVVNFIPSVQTYTTQVEAVTQCPAPLAASGWSKWDWLLLIVAAGMFFYLFRFAVRCYSLLRMRRQAQLVSHGAIRLYQVDKAIIPFSFGNAVFINRQLHSETELQEIIRHELVHVRQKHTVDVLVAELICLFNWYNPFAWLLRRSIRQNLEFIADNKVLENGVDKKQYQYLLLKVIGHNHFSIAPSFNFSSLKKRIVMMNKLQSAKIHWLRFLFVLPLAAVLLLAFRSKRIPTETTAPTATVGVADTLPPAAPSGMLPGSLTEWNPVRTASELDFIKRHTKVDKITWGFLSNVVGFPVKTGEKMWSALGNKGDMFMIIYFKNGKWDLYNISREADIQLFRKNYGEAPPKAPEAPGC